MKTIAEMKNEIIETFGFEHPNTIKFFEMCEKFPYGRRLLNGIFRQMMTEYMNEIEEE
jgi:hypothetical protein